MEAASLSLSMAILGCGQMASTLMAGILKKGEAKNYSLHMYTPSSVRAKELAGKMGGTFHRDIRDIPPCDYYLLACKPQQLPELAPVLRGILPPQSVVLSLLAGVRVESLQKHLGNHERIVRIMPNTPCRLQKGAILTYFPPAILPLHRKEITRIFQASGKVFHFDEEEFIDLLTGATSSGPALLFEMARVLEEQLIEWKVGKETARELVAQTFLGSASLMHESEDSFEQLREQVTSKGGVTFSALKVLSEGHWDQLLKKALLAAYERGKDLNRS